MSSIGSDRKEWHILNISTPMMPPKAAEDRFALRPGTGVKSYSIGKANGIQVLCGRVARNDGQEAIVIGYGWDDSWDETFVWRGSAAEFNSNWRID